MTTNSERQRLAELARMMQFLEQKGYVESRIGDDGKMRWRPTEKFEEWVPDVDDYLEFSAKRNDGFYVR
jgi:hypothetical protein